MSSPRVIIQILIVGAQIFGKAIVAAGQQAVKNAKHRPQALTDAAGVGNATSGSLTDRLTREHKMTLDEAHLILNTKKADPLETVLKNYEHLFKVNSPPPPPEAPVNPRQARSVFHSHYLQSKVVRARERIEAELKVADEMPPEGMPEGGEKGPPPPPPPSQGS